MDTKLMLPPPPPPPQQQRKWAMPLLASFLLFASLLFFSSGQTLLFMSFSWIPSSSSSAIDKPLFVDEEDDEHSIFILRRRFDQSLLETAMVLGLAGRGSLGTTMVRTPFSTWVEIPVDLPFPSLGDMPTLHRCASPPSPPEGLAKERPHWLPASTIPRKGGGRSDITFPMWDNHFIPPRSGTRKKKRRRRRDREER